jgi:hypothetical protein
VDDVPLDLATMANEPAVDDYTDEKGNVEASEVFDAIEDWRAGKIDSDIVFSVIKALRGWRKGLN